MRDELCRKNENHDINVVKESTNVSKDEVRESKNEVKSSKNELAKSKDEIKYMMKNNTKLFIIICLAGASLGILLEIINSKLHQVQRNTSSQYVAKYWVFSAYHDVENEKGLLKHVHLVLNRVGFEKSTNETSWSLLWSHDYPFRVLFPHLHRLKPHQKVNHFPGTGFITNKVDLATTESKYIPRAFKLPENKKEFLEYAEKNRNALFLEKHNQHRGVFLKNISSIDSTSGESFVQEYVQKPFLVDGHKFDIGVYVVLTSVNPLRAYWYKGDVLFRYCPAKYNPFDPANLDKYVIGDDYLPTWEVPSLAHPYTSLSYGMKDSFDIYVKSQGKDPNVIWSEVEKAIAEILVKKEHHIVQALKHYLSPENFFEMMRFDLVLDEDLKVYLLEANMSPNLSSAHYPPNQLLYEQVLYSLFSVTGVSSYLKKDKISSSDLTGAQNMISSQKNIATWGEECSTLCKSHCGEHNQPVCAMCRHCMPQTIKKNLMIAHYEHLHRTDFRRLYPPAMRPKLSPDDIDLIGLTEANKQQMLWYQGKCNIDVTWCT